MPISKDRVKPSSSSNNWKLNEIFETGTVIGAYLALVTVLKGWITFFSVPFLSVIANF